MDSFLGLLSTPMNVQLSTHLSAHVSSVIYFAEVVRYFIGFLLFFAALGKLKTFAQFKQNLTESFGLSAGVGAGLAPVIVGTELLLAVLVLLNHPVNYLAMAASLLMFVLFTSVVAYQFVKEGIVKCSCFGEDERRVSGFDLLRNAIVIGSIVFYLLGASANPVLGLPMQLLSAALGLILTIIAIEFHQIATLLSGSE